MWGPEDRWVWGLTDPFPASGPRGDGPDAVTPEGIDVSDATSSPVLSIELLGRFRVLADGQDLHLAGRHAQALFTLLALTRRPRTREAIATDLWPDAMVSATGPLRQALYQLRSAIGAMGVDPDAILESDAESLGLRADAIGTLDVLEFERCTDDPSCDGEAAVTIYAGDLAEGLGHECFAAERERLADRYEDVLAVVGAARLRAGDLTGARLLAERLIARDPLREEAYAILMEVHGMSGTRAQIVRQYRRLSAILARELGEDPLPETDAAYRMAMQRAVSRSYERAGRSEPAQPTLAVVGR